MKKYVALLRGINVGGNNAVSMSVLKTVLEKYGFQKVVTYLNSGNVIFETNIEEKALPGVWNKLIKQSFKIDIKVCIINSVDYIKMVQKAPKWWNQDPKSKHNAIFITPPMTYQQAIKSIGESKPEYEKLLAYDRVIFWSAPLATFSRTRWAQITKHKEVYQAVTIRNANTTNNLAKLLCN